MVLDLFFVHAENNIAIRCQLNNCYFSMKMIVIKWQKSSKIIHAKTRVKSWHLMCIM